MADLAKFLSRERFLDHATDAHCFAYAYQALKLGTLVGMPVPGSCAFAGWEMLPDGGTRWGVPGAGVKNNAGQYLENHQTDPDVAVMNFPG